MCLQGASRVAAALEGFPLGEIGMFIAWVPMLPPDASAAAKTAAEGFAYAAHYWDGERHLAGEMGRALGITAKESTGIEGECGWAWDVYLAYGPADGDPLRPRFWMHQLALTHAPRLDPAEFRRRFEPLLRR
jgi:hypothetical protein